MMKILLSALTLLVLWLPVPNLTAQEVFAGRGISGMMNGSESAQETTAWPKLKDFSLGEPPRLFNFGNGNTTRPAPRWFSPDGSRFKLFQPRQTGQTGALNLPTFSEIFPPRDPNRPSLFQQWNERSKAFVDRTTDWAQRQNENLRARTYSTWDSITRGLNRTSESTSQVRPTFPSSRTANSPGSGSKIKF